MSDFNIVPDVVCGDCEWCEKRNAKDNLGECKFPVPVWLVEASESATSHTARCSDDAKKCLCFTPRQANKKGISCKHHAVLHGDIVMKTDLERDVAVKILEAACAKEDDLKLTFFITNKSAVGIGGL